MPQHKWIVVAGAAPLALALMVGIGEATPLPVINFDFLTFAGTPPKDAIASVNPTGWTATGAVDLATPGTASNPNAACGRKLIESWGCPSTLPISGGYNEVEADANPRLDSTVDYMLTGLTPGQTYTLSFYQAASQEYPFMGKTTEQWIVSLGTSGLHVTNLPGCGFTFGTCSYASNDPMADLVATPAMTTQSAGLSDWQPVTINLKADAATQVLSFLAWGDNGNTANLPPIVFLVGNVALRTPEPGSLVLLGTGLLGIGTVPVLRRTRRQIGVLPSTDH